MADKLQGRPLFQKEETMGGKIPLADQVLFGKNEICHFIFKNLLASRKLVPLRRVKLSDLLMPYHFKILF